MGGQITRFCVLLGMLVVLAAAGHATTLSESRSRTTAEASENQVAAVQPSIEVYILRGGAAIFSTGLTKLAVQLEQQDIQSTTLSHAAWRLAEQKILANRLKHGRRPIVIIGHSLGANSAIHLAEALQTKGVNVELVVSYAATVSLAVPSNVCRVTNYYFRTGGWGAVLTKGAGFDGTLENRDVSVINGLSHFNVDDDPTLRNQVVRSVLRCADRAVNGGPKSGHAPEE